MKRLLFVILFILLLSACQDGSGGGDSQPRTTPPNGQEAAQAEQLRLDMQQSPKDRAWDAKMKENYNNWVDPAELAQ